MPRTVARILNKTAHPHDAERGSGQFYLDLVKDIDGSTATYALLRGPADKHAGSAVEFQHWKETAFFSDRGRRFFLDGSPHRWRLVRAVLDEADPDNKRVLVTLAAETETTD